MYKQQMGAARQELRQLRQSRRSQLLIGFLLNCGHIADSSLVGSFRFQLAFPDIHRLLQKTINPLITLTTKALQELLHAPSY